MNRIVRDRYPVADLPDDLKTLVGGEQYVRLVMGPVEPEEAMALNRDSDLVPPSHVMSLEELFALRRPPYRTTEEIVADIRWQRDEWDD